MIVDTRTWKIRYVLYKRLYEEMGKNDIAPRSKREFDHLEKIGLHLGPESKKSGQLESDWRQATIACVERRRRRSKAEPFALLHRS
jgi:hypothetical protein